MKLFKLPSLTMPSVETQLSLTDAVMAQDLHSSSMSLSEILMEDEIVRQRVDGLEQMKKVFLAILTLLAGPRK